MAHHNISSIYDTGEVVDLARPSQIHLIPGDHTIVDRGQHPPAGLPSNERSWAMPHMAPGSVQGYRTPATMAGLGLGPNPMMTGQAVYMGPTLASHAPASLSGSNGRPAASSAQPHMITDVFMPTPLPQPHPFG